MSARDRRILLVGAFYRDRLARAPRGLVLEGDLTMKPQPEPVGRFFFRGLAYALALAALMWGSVAIAVLVADWIA